jgi:hypothetical protein
MKDAVVRARIDPELKAQAAAVLSRGLPFAVRNPGVRVVSGKRLWAMKHKAQARDHGLAARREVSPEAMLLLRPKRLQGAHVEWPEGSLIDD